MSCGTQWPFRAPHCVFFADVGLHQLGDDFVLLGQLGILLGNTRFELGDLTSLDRLGGRTPPSLALEGAGTVLEQLRLPAIELARLELVLIAQIGHGHLVDEPTPQNGELLGTVEVVTRLSHGIPPLLGVMLTPPAEIPIP